MSNDKRWYDESELGSCIDLLEKTEKSERDRIFKDVKEIIVAYDPEIIMHRLFDFPVQDRKRWYDMEPVSWLVVNILFYVDATLLGKVVGFLKAKLTHP